MQDIHTILRDRQLPKLLQRMLMMNRKRKPAKIRFNRTDLKQKVITRRWGKPKSIPF